MSGPDPLNPCDACQSSNPNPCPTCEHNSPPHHPLCDCNSLRAHPPAPSEDPSTVSALDSIQSALQGVDAAAAFATERFQVDSWNVIRLDSPTLDD